MNVQVVKTYPEWVPEEAVRYLEHTEAGRSIRHLARQAGCHPSTVLRQVRRIENRRDDPLIDRMLEVLAQRTSNRPAEQLGERSEAKGEEDQIIDLLHALSFPGAVLAIAAGLDKAVVVREAEGQMTKVAVDRSLAGLMALRNWISCTRTGSVSRYQITAAGRATLASFLAIRANRERLGDQQEADGTAAAFGKTDLRSPKKHRQRYGMCETPLETLSRLVDKDGEVFLSRELVEAGKRLREDYELSQIGDYLNREKDHHRQNSCEARGHQTIEQGASAERARARTKAAFRALGVGLCDIAVKCCCHLEGLEAAERQLGWSARSGKIVLRIALMQLHAHYVEWDKSHSSLIG